MVNGENPRAVDHWRLCGLLLDGRAVVTQGRTLFKGNRHRINNLFLSGFEKKKKNHIHTEQQGKVVKCQQWESEVRVEESSFAIFATFL